MSDMPFFFKIFSAIMIFAIFYVLFRCNKHWFLKLSVLFYGVYVVLAIFTDIGKNEKIMSSPVFAIPQVIFSIGMFIAFFAGIGNAMKSSLSFTNVFGVIVIIALICTGIGAPIGIALIIKSLAKENVNRYEKK